MTGYLYQNFPFFEHKFDTIIVGSGIGGLAAATILAKAGKKVLVLERHYVIGGYTHSFQRKGYVWDVGLHYAGEFHVQGSALNRVFRYLCDDTMRWAPMDDAYDKVFFGEKNYTFVTGRENLKAHFKKYFPATKDQKSIDQYFELIAAVEKSAPAYFFEKALPPFLSKIIGPLLRKNIMPYAKQTTYSALKKITDNEKLIGLFTAQYLDFGLEPSQSSFFMHALVASHFMNGACYPEGGAGNIAKSIVPVIEKHGGMVLFKADVKNIIIENNQAIGVEMQDGRQIFAKTIISDVGAPNTFKKLLPPQVAAKHHLIEKITKLNPSTAHVGLYIGINDSPENLKLPKTNYWIFPDQSNHALSHAQFKSFNDEIPVTYISFPAAKNPEWQKEHPNKTTVEMIIGAPYEWFTDWENTTSHHRRENEKYQALKQQISEKLFTTLFKFFPQLEGKIDYFEISTPLSTQKYTNHPKGEIYGLIHSPARFQADFLRAYTPVKNLFLTGQDIMISSVGGAMMGGVICASAILKKNILNQINREIS